MMARLSRMAAVVSAIGVCAVVTTSTPAGAIGPTDFSMSPTSGPGGTVVTIAGAGCAPGLLLSGSLDRVVVTMASAPPASVQIAVTSNGAWSGTLTVPANAAAAPAVVTAVCFTDGLQSLLTIYTPKTFTVTSAAAPSTTTPGTQAPTTTVPEPTHQPPATHPPGHGSGSTPTSKPGGPRTTHPDGGGPVAGVPGGPGAGSSDPGGANNGGESSGAGKTASGKRADTVGVAADLRAPDLTSTGAGDGGSGLGWIGRLALVLLIAGAIAGALLFRRYRYGSTPNEA